MAKVQIKMPEDFLLKLSRLGNKTDEILPKVLEAGGEVVLEKVRSNLQAVIGRDTKEESRSTGELVSALGNYNVKVGFAEPRSDGRSNAMIANVLEYGKSGQPAKPFLKPARTASRAPCIEAMKRTFEQEVEKI